MKRFVLIFLVLVGSIGWGFVEVGYAERCDYNSSPDGTCGKENLVTGNLPQGVKDVRANNASPLFTQPDGTNGTEKRDNTTGGGASGTPDSTGNSGTPTGKSSDGDGMIGPSGTGDSSGAYRCDPQDTSCDPNNPSGTPNNGTPTPGTTGGGSKAVKVIVTEKLPGMKEGDCEEISSGGPGTKKYRCTVKSGYETIQAMMGGLIKYATFLTALIGMLMVVFSGFQYATSAGDGDSQKKAVIRIQKLIGGLILLFLTGFILNTIAPWIYQ